jgi:hypothetical protein
MEKSVYVNKVILGLSAPGQVDLSLLRELAFYGNLLEHSLHDSEASQKKVEFDIASDVGEYFMEESDDKFTALLERKLSKNYPSNY